MMAESLVVLFRADRTKNPEITAVFPTEPGGSTYGDMTCYAHIGQHASCSWQWYCKTRKARPEEYADLLAELRQIYEQHSNDEPVKLVVRQRITRDMHDELMRRHRREA